MASCLSIAAATSTSSQGAASQKVVDAITLDHQQHIASYSCILQIPDPSPKVPFLASLGLRPPFRERTSGGAAQPELKNGTG